MRREENDRKGLFKATQHLNRSFRKEYQVNLKQYRSLRKQYQSTSCRYLSLSKLYQAYLNRYRSLPNLYQDHFNQKHHYFYPEGA